MAGYKELDASLDPTRAEGAEEAEGGEEAEEAEEGAPPTLSSFDKPPSLNKQVRVE